MHYAHIRRVWAFLLVALACAVPAEPLPEAPASDPVTPRLRAKRRTTFACIIDGVEKVVVFSDPPVSAPAFPDSWLQLAPEPAADVATQAPLLGFMVANEPAADVAIQAPLLECMDSGEPAADVAIQAPLLEGMDSGETAADVATQAPLLGTATENEAFPLPPPWYESGLRVCMASRDDPEQARPAKPPDPMDPEHSPADEVIRELTAQSLPLGRVIDFGDPDGPVARYPG